MSRTFSRDSSSDWDDGWSRVPHGLWTLDLPCGAKILLGWLHSHTDAFLATVSMTQCRREVGSSSIFAWFEALEAAGYVAIERSEAGKPAHITLRMKPWWSLIGRPNQSDFGRVTSPKSDDTEEQGEDQPSSLRSEGVVQSQVSTETPADAPATPSSIGVKAAQLYTEMHRSERGVDPVAPFHGLRAVATALAKRGYAASEIAEGMWTAKAMTAKAVGDEIAARRRMANETLGPPVPASVVRAFTDARQWFTEHPHVNSAIGMPVVASFLRSNYGIEETMLRLAVAASMMPAIWYPEQLRELMWAAKVDRFTDRGLCLPEAMERAFRNKFWRAG